MLIPCEMHILDTFIQSTLQDLVERVHIELLRSSVEVGHLQPDVLLGLLGLGGDEEARHLLTDRDREQPLSLLGTHVHEVSSCLDGTNILHADVELLEGVPPLLQLLDCLFQIHDRALLPLYKNGSIVIIPFSHPSYD